MSDAFRPRDPSADPSRSIRDGCAVAMVEEMTGLLKGNRMSCHIELDFLDDGTLAVTSCPAKGLAPKRTAYNPMIPDGYSGGKIDVHAGTEMGVTHYVIIMTKEAYENQQNNQPGACV